MKILLFLLCLLCLLSEKEQLCSGAEQCEKIEMPVCFDMRYNLTRMPNSLGHSKQKEAAEAIEEFLPLVRIACSRFLRFFLCSKYAPVCSVQQDGSSIVVPPCRTLCLEVKRDCSPVLARFNLSWPSSLSCHHLPWSNQGPHFCVEPPQSTGFNEEFDGNKKDSSLYKNEDDFNDFLEYDEIDFTPKTSKKERSKINYGKINDNLKKHLFKKFTKSKISNFNKTTKCRDPYHGFSRSNSSKNCQSTCEQHTLLSLPDKQEIRLVFMFVSFVVILMSLLVVLSYASGVLCLEQPQKAVFYISFTTLLHSSLYAFITMLILLSEERIDSSKKQEGNKIVKMLTCKSSSNTLIYNDLSNTPCNIILLLLLYTETSTLTWWLVVSLSWFLSATLKWSQEAISELNIYHHLFAWLSPIIICLICIISAAVEADDVLGFCRVGASSQQNLLFFIILPQGLSLLFGGGLQITGFVSMSKALSELKGVHMEKDVTKLKRLVWKMFAFLILFSLALITLFSCNIFKYFLNQNWEFSLKNCQFKERIKSQEAAKVGCMGVNSRALKYTYLTQTSANALMSMSPLLWLCSKKTFAKSKNFFEKPLALQNV